MLKTEEVSLLKEILLRGSELERNWDSRTSKQITELQKLIRTTSDFPTADLNRLCKWAEHLTQEMSLRHFVGILVPFERLAQRTLRDDEFVPVLTGDRITSAPRERLELVPVLENIRSAFNVGAIFRTSECWGVEKVILTGYSPDPSDEKTAKTAMGTDDVVKWERKTHTAEACAELKRQGYTIVALETVATAPELPGFRFPLKTALLLGNERFGLDPDSLKLADQVCRIPVRGLKNSLNVGIAYGIATYEFYRQTFQNQDQL
jgi:23S rRNA (guanosine2251-2'-O)-methyltransferase